MEGFFFNFSALQLNILDKNLKAILKFFAFRKVKMGAKKKVASKTDTLAATTPSREPSNIDFGFTLTGNMELDFPEGMKKYGKIFERINRYRKTVF